MGTVKHGGWLLAEGSMRVGIAFIAVMALSACATSPPETGTSELPSPADVDVASSSTPPQTAATSGEASEAEEPSADSSAALAGGEAAKDASADGLICKSMQVTGSRFTRKVCYTAEEWAKFDSAAEEFMRELNRQPTGGKPM